MFFLTSLASISDLWCLNLTLISNKNNKSSKLNSLFFHIFTECWMEIQRVRTVTMDLFVILPVIRSHRPGVRHRDPEEVSRLRHRVINTIEDISEMTAKFKLGMWVVYNNDVTHYVDCFKIYSELKIIIIEHSFIAQVFNPRLEWHNNIFNYAERPYGCLISEKCILDIHYI